MTPQAPWQGARPSQGQRLILFATTTAAGLICTVRRCRLCIRAIHGPAAAKAMRPLPFRRDRDAAHVDGLIGEGHPKRRYLREPHQFILGIVLTDNPPDAAPLVVWKGSHKMMQQTFAAAGAPGDLDQLDLTDCYQETRRQAFSLCPRLPLTGPPGTAILLHRHLLHGVAPWAAGAGHSAQGRMIAYFRPLCPGRGRAMGCGLVTGFSGAVFSRDRLWPLAFQAGARIAAI